MEKFFPFNEKFFPFCLNFKAVIKTRDNSAKINIYKTNMLAQNMIDYHFWYDYCMFLQTELKMILIPRTEIGIFYSSLSCGKLRRGLWLLKEER